MLQCIAEKQQITILYSLVWPDRDWNPQSTALEVSTLTIPFEDTKLLVRIRTDNTMAKRTRSSPEPASVTWCGKSADDRRRTPSDGKSSHCLWQGELKRTINDLQNIHIKLNNVYKIILQFDEKYQAILVWYNYANAKIVKITIEIKFDKLRKWRSVVKPAHSVTSMKQSHGLRGSIFRVLS